MPEQTHPQRNDAQRYLELGFEAKRPEDFILIWTLEGRKSRWFKDVPQAARYAMGETSKNVFAGVASSPSEFGTGRRCKQDATSGIGWLWSDIDVASPAHRYEELPPTKQRALEILEGLPEPSLVVDTGGGLHCYWRLHEYWVFETHSEREEAKALMRRLTLALKNAAGRKRWHVDSVPDLSRVLRVPGTFNHKPEYGEPLLVRILTDRDELCYDPLDFDTFLPEDPGETRAATETELKRVASTLKGDKSAQVSDKFLALLANDEEANREWHYKAPKKHKAADMTASGRDMRLGYRCARGGLTDQEIQDVLVAFRRQRGLPLKLDHPSYYVRTIANIRARLKEHKRSEEERAKQKRETRSRLQQAESLLKKLEEEESKVDPIDIDLDELEQTKNESELMKIVNRSWKSKRTFLRFQRYKGDDPELRVTMEDGSAYVVKSVDEVISQAKFIRRFATHTGDYCSGLARPEWYVIARSIIAIAFLPKNVIDLGEEATEEGAMKLWMDSYLESRLDESLSKNTFFEGRGWRGPAGELFVNSTAFLRFVQATYDRGVSDKKVLRLLRGYGFRPHTKVRIPGMNKVISCWRLKAKVKGEEEKTSS